MSEQVVLVERADGLAVVTLNRPASRNALNAALRRGLRDTFRELENDASVRAVILTGAGKAFCAGLDLKEMGERGPGAGGEGEAGGLSHGLVETIERYPHPVIGAINGVAITGGFELALACDVLVGCPETRFADTHARVGILPGWGLSQKLSRVMGPWRAKLVSFTGNFISADESERWGLLARVVPSDQLMPTCRQLAKDMLSCVPGALAGYKRMIDEGYAINYGDARALEVKLSNEHIRSVSAKDIAERRAGVVARGRSQSS
ncbi:MAG TPA: enoyl-CoA hydratase [Myxococcota bacterium]|jgi:enoyl-CoA hydratase